MVNRRKAVIDYDQPRNRIETGKISQMEAAEPELIDVAPGLWLWQVQYQEWPRGHGWDWKVVSICVESGGEIAMLRSLTSPEIPVTN